MPNYPLISEMERMGWVFMTIDPKIGLEMVKVKEDVIFRECSPAYQGDLRKARSRIRSNNDTVPWGTLKFEAANG